MVKAISSFTLVIVAVVEFFGYISVCEANVSSQCGPESLTIVAKNMGITTNVERIRELAGTTQFGTTMLGLRYAAEELNLPAVPVKLTPEQYRDLNVPLIAWVDGNHYVVVWGCKWFGTKVEIQDPPGKRQVIPMSVFQKRWGGEALAFSEKLTRRYNEQRIAEKEKRHVGAHAYFDTTVFFAGTINEGEQVKHVFRFSNTGLDTLNLYARSTCSCTATMMNDQLIPPGGEGEIEVQFDTTGRRGATQQSVDVRTNDANQPWVKLILAATVKNTVKIVPQTLWFDDILPNQRAERFIRILGADDGNMKVQSIESPSSIQTRIYPAVVDSVYGPHIPVKITLIAGNAPGEINEQVTVVFESGQRIEVPLSTEVVSQYRAYPPVAIFNAPANGTQDFRDIDIVPRKSSQMTASSSSFHIEKSSDAITATIIDTQHEISRLRITHDTMVHSAIVDTLRLYQLDNRIPVLTIPVFIAN